MFKNTVQKDTVIFYASFIAFLYGITLDVSVWWWVLAAISHIIVVTVFSATIHRYYCHESFKANENLMFVLAVISTTYFYSNPLQWRVVHSVHHAYSDGPKDAHIRGLRGFFGLGYVTTMPETKFLKLSIKLMRSSRHVWISKNTIIMSTAWALVLLMFGFNWFLFMFAIPVFTNHLCNRLHKQFAHGAINNGSGATEATSRWWLEYIFPMGGEWIHRQHHVVSNEPYYKTKWYHLDTGGMLIKLLSR